MSHRGPAAREPTACRVTAVTNCNCCVGTAAASMRRAVSSVIP